MDELKMSLFGGYDKIETLKYIDTLTSEIYLLESALERRKKGEEFEIPSKTEKRELRTSAIGGFDKENTDRYTEELRQKAAGLREKLISA